MIPTARHHKYHKHRPPRHRTSCLDRSLQRWCFTFQFHICKHKEQQPPPKCMKNALSAANRPHAGSRHPAKAATLHKWSWVIMSLFKSASRIRSLLPWWKIFEFHFLFSLALAFACHVGTWPANRLRLQESAEFVQQGCPSVQVKLNLIYTAAPWNRRKSIELLDKKIKNMNE